jgi:hypothetical protein
MSFDRHWTGFMTVANYSNPVCMLSIQNVKVCLAKLYLFFHDISSIFVCTS